MTIKLEIGKLYQLCGNIRTTLQTKDGHAIMISIGEIVLCTHLQRTSNPDFYLCNFLHKATIKNVYVCLGSRYEQIFKLIS